VFFFSLSLSPSLFLPSHLPYHLRAISTC
jgi:hypothetical protein